MNKKNLTLNYSLLQIFYWMGFCTLMAFSSVYLLSNGLTSTLIGIVIALGGTIGAIIQPIIAAYADKPGSLSLRMIIMIMSLSAVVLGAGLLLNGGHSRIISVILYVLAISLLYGIQPMVNAISMASVNQGHALNFGVSRAAGSTGFALLSWTLGMVVASQGPAVIPVGIILWFGLLALSSFLYPFRKSEEKSREESKEQNSYEGTQPSGSLRVFFNKHRKYCVMLIGMILVLTSHALINNFTLQIVVAKGGDSAAMGTATAISALVELPIMVLFTIIVKRIRCHNLIRIAPAFFFLKILTSLLVRSVPAFYGIQIFQMLGWALYSVAIVYYVNGIMGQEDAVKGQAYATMAMTVGNVIASLAGGRMIDALGVNAMLIAGSLCAAVGAVIVFFSVEKSDNKK